MERQEMNKQMGCVHCSARRTRHANGLQKEACVEEWERVNTSKSHCKQQLHNCYNGHGNNGETWTLWQKVIKILQKYKYQSRADRTTSDGWLVRGKKSTATLAIVDNPGSFTFECVEKEVEVYVCFCVKWGCFVLSKLWKHGINKAYTQCQKIMSLSLWI